MERHNLDLGVPLTSDQWRQVGEAADFQADDGVLEWTPGEFDTIHVSIRPNDAPRGWDALKPRTQTPRVDHEVARFVYNDGRPMAQLTPPDEPAPPAVTAAQDHEMAIELERWVRDKWHCLMEAAGLHDNPGAIPEKEPRPVD